MRKASQVRTPSGFASLCAMVLGAMSLCASSPVHASDFWDEVKNPGLRLYRQNVAAAQDALQAHRFAEARELASQAREQFPNRPEAHMLGAIASGEEELGNDVDSAVEVEHGELAAGLTRALALLDEGQVEPHLIVRAGTVAAQAHEFELAVPFLRRVLRDMQPGAQRSQLFCVFGDSLMALGAEHLEEAVRAYREAARSAGPWRAQARLGLALALRRQGLPDWRTVLADLTERDVVRASGQMFLPEGEAIARDAVFWESQGETAPARTAWERAVRFTPWATFNQAQLDALAPPRRGGRPSR